MTTIEEIMAALPEATLVGGDVVMFDPAVNQSVLVARAGTEGMALTLEGETLMASPPKPAVEPEATAADTDSGDLSDPPQSDTTGGKRKRGAAT